MDVISQELPPPWKEVYDALFPFEGDVEEATDVLERILAPHCQEQKLFLGTSRAQLTADSALAFERGRSEIIKLLVDKGGLTDIDLAESIALCIAFGQAKLMKLLIDLSGLNVNTTFQSRNSRLTNLSPLHLAAKHNQHDCAQTLIYQHHADPNISNPQGETPLHFACYFGSTDVFKFLLAVGANTTVKTAEGETPLALAARCGHREIVRILVDNGDANPLETDKHGDTPIAKAENAGHTEIVEILKQQQRAASSTITFIDSESSLSSDTDVTSNVSSSDLKKPKRTLSDKLLKKHEIIPRRRSREDKVGTSRTGSADLQPPPGGRGHVRHTSMPAVVSKAVSKELQAANIRTDAANEPPAVHDQIHIKVEEARGLEFDNARPEVIVVVTHVVANATAGEVRTKPKKSKTPAWNAELSIPLTGAVGMLKVEVFDHQNLIGGFTAGLAAGKEKTVAMATNAPQWFKLLSDKGDVRGELKLSAYVHESDSQSAASRKKTK